MKTKAKSVKYYILRFIPNGTLDIFEKMNDIDFLIQSLEDILKKQFQSKDVEYCFKFICCSTNLSNAGRQRVMARHKSYNKRTTCKKEKRKLCTNGTCHEKKNVLSDKAIWYKSLDLAEKEKLLSHRA